MIKSAVLIANGKVSKTDYVKKIIDSNDYFISIDAKSENLKLGIRSEYITVENEHSDNSLEADVIEVEDFGNYKLITASFDSFKIKAKVKRELDIPSEKVILKLPAEHCCIYEDNKLI